MQPFIQITEEISLPMKETYENSLQMDEMKLLEFARKNSLDVEVTTRGCEEYPFKYFCTVNNITILAISKVEFLAD